MLLQHVVSEWYGDEKNRFLSLLMQRSAVSEAPLGANAAQFLIFQHVPILLRPPQQVAHDLPDLAQSIS